MSNKWQQFISSVLLLVLFPLIPLLFEFWQSQSISPKSFLLLASVYAITTGVVSKHSIIFVLSIIIGLILAYAYGVSSKSDLPEGSVALAIIATVFFFITSTSERYKIHVVNEIKFFNFS